MHLAVPDLDDSQHDALALQTTEDVLKMLFKDKIYFFNIISSNVCH